MNVTQENSSVFARLWRSPLALLAVFGIVTATVAVSALSVGMHMGSAGASPSELAGAHAVLSQPNDTRAGGLACPIIDEDEPDSVFAKPPAVREGQLRGLTVIPVNSTQVSIDGSRPFPEITALVGGTPRQAVSTAASDLSAIRTGAQPGASPDDGLFGLLGGAALAALALGVALNRRKASAR